MDTTVKPKESKFIKTHQPCPDCDSSDGLAINDDGSTHCFVCNEHKLDAINPNRKKNFVRRSKTFEEYKGEIEPLPDRKIHEETCKKFSYYVDGNDNHIANYFNDEGHLVGQKIRTPRKDFKILGEITHRFYGQHLWPNGGKKLVITEGEVDCLTVSQLNKNSYPCVSIPSGTNSAKRVVKTQLKWLEKFEEIVLMFDGDKAGREGVESIIRILPPGKAFVAKLPEGEDPNSLLVKGDGAKVVRAMWDAGKWAPPHIVEASSLYDELKHLKPVESASYPFEGLNKKSGGGIRKGEIVTLCAGSGVGKSQVCRTIAHHLLTKENKKIAYIALEENNIQTAQSIVGIEMGANLRSDSNITSRDAFDTAWNKTLGKQHQFYLYDQWGSMKTDELLSDIRFYVQSLDVDVIFLDHVSICVSGLLFEIGDERKALDVLMTELRTLVEESKFALFLVSHLRRAEGNRGYEDGLAPNLSALRGSASLAQLSDQVYSLSRNLMSEERHVTTVSVLKNRFTGDTGVACHLRYDPETGRLQEEQHDF
tara:strand:- start:6770 stop:8380 length:1611 start_codon:yes stop_codon:yes gene_type:complete